jgi:Cys-tRNA(Pro)/Cys-tRNA(Cys) deacylase
LDKLKSYLQAQHIDFELINHEKPIRTAKEGVQHLGVAIVQTAPTFIVKTKQAYYGLIVSGSRGRINLDEVASILGVAELQFADPDDVLEVTGFKVGTVPLLLNLPCLFDTRLLQYDYIYGGTGELTTTLKISPHHVEKLNDVIAYLV